MKISTFTLKDKEIEFTYANGFLAYTFQSKGKSFGYKLKPESKGIMHVASATFLLLVNCLETIEAVEKLNE